MSDLEYLYESCPICGQQILCPRCGNLFRKGGKLREDVYLYSCRCGYMTAFPECKKCNWQLGDKLDDNTITYEENKDGIWDEDDNCI